MERNLGREMEQQKNYEQVRYNIVEARNEGLGSANQRFLHDPSSTINTNMRPPDFNITVAARPVLNYSIQTGEEFALEFMNPRQHFVPSASGDPNSATNYAVLKGFLGASHTGSESGPDIPMLTSVEKSRVQEFERKSSSVHEDKGYYDSVRSVPRISSRNDSSRGLHGYASSGVSERSSTKVKFLCSFGGKILPRPSDGKLRYVGGETRIIRMNKDISWQDLLQKTMTIYNQSHTIKYQLPGEDLDALVSVSCDEDLQNMMEECNVLEDGGSQKLRLFLFSSSDFDDGQFGLGSMEGDSEIQYVVAVNGMDLESRKNSIGLASTSDNNLDELLNLNVERETGRVATELPGPSTAPSTVNVHSSAVQSSQPLVPNFSGAYESNSKPYQGQKMRHGEAEQHQVFPVHHLESVHDLDGRNSVPFSVQFPYGYGSQPFNYGPFGENLVHMPLHGHVTRQGGLAEDQMHSDVHVHVQDLEVSAKEDKLKRDNSSQKMNEPEKNRSLEKEVSVKEAKIKTDSSVQKMNELEKIRSLESEHNVSSHPHEGSVPNYIPREEASVVNSTADIGVPMLLPKTSKKYQESVQISKPPEAVSDGKINTFNGDGHFHTSGGAFSPGYGDSEADPTEVSYPEQTLIPPRVFHSERIPREQAELNRLSKSDDSFGSQFLMSHTRSDVSQQVAESIDKLHGGNATSQSEQAASSTTALYTNPKTVEDGLTQFEKYKDVADDIKKLNSNISEDGLGPKLLKSESKWPAPTSMDDHEIAGVRDGNKDPAVSDREAAGLNNLTASQGTSSKPHDDSPSKPTGFHWDEMAVKKNNDDNTKGHAQPMAWTENPLRSVPGGESSVGVGAPEGGDILIDINDRFPRDFLSDIFSKARTSEGPPGISPLHGDGTGLSLNLENHEPKHWSFFQKLAQEEFIRKGVSLMDQDHLGYPSSLMNIEDGTPIDYSFPPLKSDGVALGPMDSRINFEEEIQQESSSMVRPNTLDIHEDYDPSPVKRDESVQMDGMVNPRTPDSDYEEGKLEIQNTGAPFVDPSLGDIDISTLQIIKNEDLEELRELGSGTFGTVYHGKWRGTDVAIKRIKKSCFTGRSSEQERLTVEFWREADILSKLHHPNVVAFYGVVQDGPGGTLATVTEFMVNGSLRHVLVSKDRHLDRRKRLIIAMDAAFGMEYLHSKNIVHFDLKCDNLLVNLKDPLRPICKVGDFGLSKIKRNTLVTGGVRGTLPWMAPELLNGSSSRVSEKVDVFSFGIVLWEILTGEEPYAHMHYGAIIGGIVNNTLRPPVPSYCDSEWKLLMEQCWAPDPIGRPSFTEIARRLRAMSAACQTKPQGYSAGPAHNPVTK
ncbi:uncharacterized protein LOC117930914 [Vitis riparia]|uniref:uncharacterized protein LOC117930914 n=1 Tax=Vitis riparia TaxID=96939 RepID=UPI00155A9E52|nr:uncharacterized protein LOC117930914 [Vitis riparia]XP_034707714.1 uncharacterized protein LOC117930914 [Vitis riparia]